MLRSELFATDMVRAYQEGRKLHTARPCKLQESLSSGDYHFSHIDADGNYGFHSDSGKLPIFLKPKHRPGDYIYCRETWTLKGDEIDGPSDFFFGHEGVVYKASCKRPDRYAWFPSIHMPREAARLFFRVTKVEVMRLEDVTEEFAREDGFLAADLVPAHNPSDAFQILSARKTFENFWLDTYGPAARWMWVYWTEPCSREEAMGDVSL